MLHLVTGGSGFLGNLIAHRLLEQGERVRVLDVWHDAKQNSDIEFIKADVRDADAVANAMRGVDVVHHNAALVPLTKSGDLFWEVNVNGARTVAEEAVKAGISYFIHMSSSALFGKAEFPITNATPPCPAEPYGKSKLEGELAVRAVCENARLPFVIIRPRTLLGLGRLGIFQILFDFISANRNIYTIGDGRRRYQFLHALDMMDAYMLVMCKEKTGVYNVGAQEYGTLREVLEEVITYATSRSKIVALPVGLTIGALTLFDKLGISPLAPWHYLTYHLPYYFDINPLLELGWKPQYSNTRMFLESYDWFINNQNEMNYLNNEAGSPHRRAVKQGILKVLKLISLNRGANKDA
jgi:nucleoside-diphosphate-sugar epimerase